jgi:hypothetical protein
MKPQTKSSTESKKDSMNSLFDEYPEWVGMPEFVQEKKVIFKELIVRFETEEDYKKFQTLINQKMTNKTKSIWHPFKSHWGIEKKVYKNEP